MFVDVLGGDGFEREELVDAGVVDEDVEAAEGLGGLRYELGDLGRIGQVGLHGDGLASGGLYSLDEGFGGSSTARVVDHDGGSVGGETLGDGGAYSFGGAGYEGNFSLKIGHGFLLPASGYGDAWATDADA